MSNIGITKQTDISCVNVKYKTGDNFQGFYRASEYSAGTDISSAEDVTIPAHSMKKVATDLFLEVPSMLVPLVFPRSGLSLKGIDFANSVGVVDPDYRGELLVPLRNNTDEDYKISTGERIAQMVIVPWFCPSFEKVEKLSETERGQGGFGSSGK